MASLTLLPDPVLEEILEDLAVLNNRLIAGTCSRALLPCFVQCTDSFERFPYLGRFLLKKTEDALKARFVSDSDLAVLEWGKVCRLTKKDIGVSFTCNLLEDLFCRALQCNKALATCILHTINNTPDRGLFFWVLMREEYDTFLEMVRLWKVSDIDPKEVTTVQSLPFFNVQGAFELGPHRRVVKSKRRDVYEAVKDVFEIRETDILEVLVRRTTEDDFLVFSKVFHELQFRLCDYTPNGVRAQIQVQWGGTTRTRFIYRYGALMKDILTRPLTQFEPDCLERGVDITFQTSFQQDIENLNLISSHANATGRAADRANYVLKLHFLRTGNTQ